jgi:hypothetical protein
MEPNDELEITPEMIEAGRERLYEFEITDPSRDEMNEAVKAVFRAMLLARR